MIKIYTLLTLFILISTKVLASSDKELYCALQLECSSQSGDFFYAPKLAAYDCSEKPVFLGADKALSLKLKHQNLIQFINYQYKNLYRFYDTQTSEKVIDQLNNLSTSNIFKSIDDINSILESTNDQHVYFKNYDNYNVFRLSAVLPTSFNFINSSEGLKVYVSNIIKLDYAPDPGLYLPPGFPKPDHRCFQKYADFLSPRINGQTENIEIGDEIIEYNDTPIADLLNKSTSTALFDVDAKMKNLKNLFFKDINYEVNYLDTVKLKIKKKDNSILIVRLDWIVPHASDFVKKSDQRKGELYYFTSEADSEFAGSANSYSKNEILNNKQGVSPKSYVLFNNLSQLFTNFSHVSNKAARLYEGISKSLNPSLVSGSSGVIIDLRGNRGGKILDAHFLARAFAEQDIEPIYYDARVNDEIKKIVDFNPLVFSTQFTRSFYESYSKGLKYTTPEPKYESIRVNELGRIYKTKVIVLVDSLCFSACEVFVALLKNQPNVRIVGYGDKTTAGGGASMWNMSEFYDGWPPEKSLSFPYDPAVNINFSFEANYQRMKDGSLKAIQGHGVEVDQVIEKTFNDFTNNDADLHEKLFAIFETF